MERILIVLLSFAVGACDRPADPSEPASTGAQPAPSAEGPESIVLLISIDTLRADHLGCYGYTRNTSPVLDDLARRGVVFEDASSTAPWTLPAHATMLTGLSPLRLGWDPLSPTTPTLGSMLAANGFETAAVVNSTYLKRDTWALTRDFGRYLYVEESPSRRSPSSWVTDRAISWLDESAAPRVFLFMHYFDVHSDYASLPRHERRFTSDYAGPATGETWQLTLSDLSPDFISACRLDFEPRCRLSPSSTTPPRRSSSTRETSSTWSISTTPASARWTRSWGACSPTSPIAACWTGRCWS